MTETFLFSVLPVDNIEDPLIGREYEIDKIKNAILKFQNISIVGDIKVGKTSIMKSIEFEILKDPRFENVIPVFIDLDKNSYNLEIQELLRRIIDKIFQVNEYLEGKYGNSNLDKREVFSIIIEYCSRKKLTVLLLFDNFDSITVLKNLTEDFFTFLRGNAIEMGLSIITASRSNLETLCHKGQIAGSQFWNIFNPIVNLSLFEDISHARELLSRGFKNGKIIDLIISLVGIHPCFLKVAANAVIENGFSNSENEAEIRSLVYEKLKPYFEKRLKLLQNDANNIDNGVHYKLDYISLLSSICCIGSLDEKSNKAELSDLLRRGYIHKNSEGKLVIACSLFEKFIKEKCKKQVAPYKGDKPYIFISYAHADRAMVFDILQHLMDNDIRFWFDNAINPGNEWRKDILDALEKAQMFIVFISPSSMSSDYVTKEINRAIKKNIKILPVYLTPTELTSIIEWEIDHIQNLKKYEDEENFINNLKGAIDISCKTESV